MKRPKPPRGAHLLDEYRGPEGATTMGLREIYRNPDEPPEDCSRCESPIRHFWRLQGQSKALCDTCYQLIRHVIRQPGDGK
jgi:hypothetical protein